MATEAFYSLPEDFLTGPAPTPTVAPIDFSQTSLPQYKDLHAVVIDGVLTPAECRALVAAAEEHSKGEWERAMINIGNGQQKLITDARNCGRIIWDNRELVARFWNRIAHLVPEIQSLDKWPKVTGLGPDKRKEVWKCTRLNERMRFLKYTSGEYFRPHCDGVYETPDGKERSYFTVHLYLNDMTPDDGSEPLKGGATTFFSMNEKQRLDVDPKMGRVLLFQHKYLLHAGDDVLQGTKLTMRTDVMYERSDEVSTATKQYQLPWAAEEPNENKPHSWKPFLSVRH